MTTHNNGMEFVRCAHRTANSLRGWAADHAGRYVSGANRMRMLNIICSLIGLTYLLPTYATEPDFFINFASCKNAIGYLTLSDESLKIIEGEPLTMGCIRRADEISCLFQFENGQKGHKGNSENYRVSLDVPPLLHFKTQNGSEYISIDTGQHAAVLVSRQIGTQFSGAKVCHGFYATSFEVKNLKK